jgi:DNA adenine methylase
MNNQTNIALFPEFTEPQEPIAKSVNVSSVPQRSLFRYPGGKTWFVPTFRKWIANFEEKPKLLVEPFAGGGIISLTALFEDLVNRVLMVELDDEIAAVWQVIVNGDYQWLADEIVNFKLSKETAIERLKLTPADYKEKAFQTILKNRIYHGGILANGSGFLKYGENGKGILSRWYPETLAKRLKNISKIYKRIKFKQDDGLKVLEALTNKKDTIFFIDPPYTAGGKKAGRRLYNHFELDHEKLFSICKNLKGDFLITYDNSDEVKLLAKTHNFDFRLIPMKNTHHAEMKELVIGKNLFWLNGNII